MNRILLLLFLYVMAAPRVVAQEITIKSITEQPMDLSARIDARKDYNGNPCALVKVQLPLEELAFDGNVVGNVEYKVNEYWIYMTSGTKKLNIKHPKFLTLYSCPLTTC